MGGADFAQLLAVSAVVMGLSHTIAKERIFEPIRDRLGNMETWSGYLVSCPYCVSHWLAFLLVPVTGTFAIRVPWEWGAVSTVTDWFLSSILVTVVAAFLRVGFYFVDQSQGLIRRQQKEVEKETEILEAKVHEDSPMLH